MFILLIRKLSAFNLNLQWAEIWYEILINDIEYVRQMF